MPATSMPDASTPGTSDPGTGKSRTGKSRTGKFGIGAFWQALLVITAAYLLFAYAFPPLLPRSLMIQYMIITVIGVLLYFSSDEERWQEFKQPLSSVIRKKKLWPIRWLLLLAVPALAGYVVFENTRPSFDAPVELRQVHPAPPSKLKVYDASVNLTKLENPLRSEILEAMESSPDDAWQSYRDTVAEGSAVYYQNCFYCHGDLLDGDGPYAEGLNPRPINFQDVGTIAQLQEAFLFWRITTGGPGLPKEGTPWNSAMPVWHEMLDEESVWQVITFLYDYVGQVPRMWDQKLSRAVTGMKDDILAKRADSRGEELYQYRCAACHGDVGAGDGPAADFLYPRPRDFSLALFKYKSSPGTSLVRDEDLFQIIKHGLNGTGMPGWETLLSDAQIKSLIPVIKHFDFTAAWAPEDAEDEDFDEDGLYTKNDFQIESAIEPVEGQVPYSDESITLGRQAYTDTCAECHGEDGRGNIISGKRLEDDWGYRIWPRNLTAPWTWRSTNVADIDPTAQQQTIRNIYQRLSIGIPGTPMPAHRAESEGDEDPVSLEDRWHIANYVYSLRNAEQPPTNEPVLFAQRVEQLPADINDALWATVPATRVRLIPNIIKDERLFTPLAESVSVRVAYDNDNILFLLELDDRTDSRPGETVSTEIHDESLDMYADAFAIQFPAADTFSTIPVVEKPLNRHGDPAHPVTMWYWNAGAVEPASRPQTMVFDATGVDAAPQPRQKETGMSAEGRWEKGRWRVLMKRSRQAVNENDINFEEGNYLPLAFANWDGNNGEKGSKHTLSSWYWLLLPPPVNMASLYGVSGGAAMILFMAGLLFLRRHRADI
jgi:DMSO reductase family type II enzyme heme b subunit